MLNKVKILNYLICCIPLSLILGNLITNANVILICIIGIINYKDKIFFIENKTNQYLLYLFFLFLVLTTFFNNQNHFNTNNLYLENFYKSLSFVRFLLLFLTISKLIENRDFNINLFFYFCAFFSLIIVIDIMTQVLITKNFIGSIPNKFEISIIFGSEKVAGGYLQKFILFFIFLIILKKINYKKKNLLALFLFIIFLFPIIISGNRMPAIIYVSSVAIYYISDKKFKEIFFFTISFFALIFILLKYPIIERVDVRIINFVKDTRELIVKAPKLFYYNNYNNEEIKFGGSGYLIHFNSGIQIWKKNKLFGNGLKSFPLNCIYKNNQTCNTHPHNYFIEIMMDTGLIGLILIYSLFLINFFKFIKFYTFKHKTSSLIVYPIYIAIFFEFFPIRSTGSFFTTSNATFIFLFLALFLNLDKIVKNYKI